MTLLCYRRVLAHTCGIAILDLLAYCNWHLISLDNRFTHYWTVLAELFRIEALLIGERIELSVSEYLVIVRQCNAFICSLTLLVIRAKFDLIRLGYAHCEHRVVLSVLVTFNRQHLRLVEAQQVKVASKPIEITFLYFMDLKEFSLLPCLGGQVCIEAT